MQFKSLGNHVREASDLHKRYYLQQSFTKLLKALHGFFLGSRLDETTGVPLIPANDNIFHCQLHSGGSLGESQNL